jgi:hypothetical protein
MAGMAAYSEALVLNYLLGTAANTRPASFAVGLSLGAPTSATGSEIATGSGMSRTALVMGAAASPAGTMSNATALTFGPSSGGTFSGLQVWDTVAATVGNMLFYGTLATARTLGAGDSLVFAVGALVISLA